MPQNLHAFASCAVCTTLPRFQFGDGLSTTKPEDRQQMAGPLEDLDLKEELYRYHYKCEYCGTYYRLEWNFGNNHVLRLERLTHLEMYGSLPKKRKASVQYLREYEWVREVYRARIDEMKRALNSELPIVRDFASETLADEYKETGQRGKLVDLLRHADAHVRLGAIRSFAAPPSASWFVEWPNGSRVHVDSIDKKPYIKPARVLRELINQLVAPEPHIRRYVSGLLRTFIPDANLAIVMRRVPEEKRSSELKIMLIERSWMDDEKKNAMLALYLADADQVVRRAALDRARELCDGKYGRAREENVELISAEIIKLGAAGSASEEMQLFLEDPIGPPEEYDPYD